jgi:hypothetical protein
MRSSHRPRAPGAHPRREALRVPTSSAPTGASPWSRLLARGAPPVTGCGPP